MSHYYQNDPNLESNIKLVSYYLNDNKLSFYSDNGVFSSSSIDYGSYFFIKTFLKENKVNDLLDLGCGIGVVGLSVKYFDKCNNVTMVDINERAINLTKKNIELFNLENCEAFVSDCYSNVNKKFDAILLNPPIRAGKKVIYKMYEESLNYLKENGFFYIVIKKDLGANSSIKELQKYYSNVEVIDKDKGYLVIKSY